MGYYGGYGFTRKIYFEQGVITLKVVLTASCDSFSFDTT
jgi:hypothetical protein